MVLTTLANDEICGLKVSISKIGKNNQATV